MTSTPLHSIEQPSGFTFDSMDFSMSRSSSCIIHVCPSSPTMEDWEDEEDVIDKDEKVAVEIDDDLEDDNEEEKLEQAEGDGVEVYEDDDDDFEQYLQGDDND